MEKYVSLCDWEEVVECDETTTYVDFLRSIEEKFKLRKNSFSIKGIEEHNFSERFFLKDYFEIERSEYDKALERLNRTPLHLAVCKGNEEIVELLLEKDLNNANQEDKYGYTSLYLAAYGGYTEIVKLLLEKDFDNAHQEDKNGKTPLSRAVLNGNKEIVELLLEKDFENAHTADKYGHTPLSRAISLDNDEIIELLLKDIEKRK